MKTLQSMAYEAQTKWDFWRFISDQDLDERDKSRSEAIALANYFEGKFEAYCDAMRLNNAK